jgi:vancomycin aglycone glucosyltransferase
MRVLLSTVGSRGDVQPLVAMASRLRESGHEACLCVSPDLRDWVEGHGFPFTPIGKQQRGMLSAPVAQPARPAPLSLEQLRPRAEATVMHQFTTIAEAARGCDAIVAVAGRLPFAARSVAETLGIGYVFATFSPVHLPSPHHPPFPVAGQDQSSAAGNLELWSRDAERFNDRLRPALNSCRASAGLAPVDDVRSHVFTSRPWLAADPVLAPWPGPAGGAVWQAGAWILPDQRPLDPVLEAFLQAGEPPVYFGFGSMRMPPEVAPVIAAAARRAGRRAVISAGWAGLALAGGEPGCLVIGEVNQQNLFGRVAAVVHHGGAGTTTAAALAGAPQVVIPQAYDQHYWAQRVARLGIGTAHPPGTPDADSLAAALQRALQPGVAARARALSPAIRTGGTQAAAANLIAGLRDSAGRRVTART